jgi:hypothetical protein
MMTMISTRLLGRPITCALFLSVLTSRSIVLGQATPPDPLSEVKDPSERHTIERALVAKDYELFSDSRVCGVGRLPTDGAGPLLVVSIEENGRYCNTVLVIRSAPKPEIIETFQPTGGADRLDSLLRDLDNDGVPELVFDRYVGHFSSDCYADIPVVYRRTLNGCSDQSRRFPDLFVSELDRLRYKIAALAGSNDADSSCLIIARDKILRQLGRDNLAGLPLAREWAKSSNRDTRAKAALVASDIDDPAAAELLDKLAVDRDDYVGTFARQQRDVRDRRPQDRSR